MVKNCVGFDWYRGDQFDARGSTLPPLLDTPNKSFAMLVGFIVLAGLYFKFKQIVPATLTAALSYGLVYTYIPMPF